MGLRIADRSARGKLALSGEQDAWFLHQILTQDFESMTVGEARDAAQLTAHGRMVGFLEAVRTEDGFLLHFEEDLKGTYPEQIARYVFATRVEIDDVGDSKGLLLVVGEGWEDAAAAHPEAIPHPTRALGIPAGYLWLPAGDVDKTVSGLQAEGAEEIAETELEAIRISNGVPRWGRDMDSKTIPQEVGVDGWAVDFDKGCYVGQEAMAKIHFRGKVNRRLARLRGEVGEVGLEVRDNDQKVGRITSLSGDSALAVVRYTVEPGDLVEVAGVKVEVVA